MKKIVLVSIALLALTSAFAQAEVILVWADAGFTTCNYDNPVALATVYVTHENVVGTTASQYSLTENSGTLTWIADVNQFTLSLGTSQTGYAVSYGGCLSGPIHVQNVLYSVAGTPAPCTGITVEPDPNALTGEIEGVDCGTPRVKTFPNASFMSFNTDGSCVCGEIVPVEETSWGKLKALYE